MSAKSEYLDWKLRQLAVGCLFARMIATRPRDYGQHIELVTASSSARRIADGVDRVTGRLIGDSTVSAATILLPRVSTLQQLAEGMWALRNRPAWNVSVGALAHPIVGNVATVAITRQIANAQGVMLPSEALVLGPFDEFPPTRRAPVVAMEIYVGSPLETDPKTGGPATKVNLAHIRTPNLPDQTYLEMIDRSGKLRRKSLGLSLAKGATDEDLRAKARVSFVLPVPMAATLGMLP